LAFFDSSAIVPKLSIVFDEKLRRLSIFKRFFNPTSCKLKRGIYHLIGETKQNLKILREKCDA